MNEWLAFSLAWFIPLLAIPTLLALLVFFLIQFYRELFFQLRRLWNWLEKRREK